ncbi:MAG: hypothetical protein HKN24_03805, partial [Acidimicrobiales bacterium]|nr:hypothetical protein [Acidimicrobiales bacterium]
MSRSMPLRRKISAAFAIPLIAVGVVVGVGVASATEDHSSALAARDTFDRIEALQFAALSVGQEQLGAVLSDEGDAEGVQTPLIEATDAALADLARFGDNVVTDQVWTSLSAARSTPVGRNDNYVKATALLLASARAIEVRTSSAEAVDRLSDLDGLHRLVQADNDAWLGFATRTSDDFRSSATILDSFAVAAATRADLDARTADDPDGVIQR